MATRNLAIRLTSRQIKKLDEEGIGKLFDSSHLRLSALSCVDVINNLTLVIRRIENEVLSIAKLKDDYHILTTIPGIGMILAMTIMFEIGDINRFGKVGNYSSYCRSVSSQRLSNGKRKGANNRKNGNRYLSWAYTEAANFARRYCPMAAKFYQRKMAATNKIVATKALGNKLTKATWYMLKHKAPYDPMKLFR
jgi:transposase